MAKGRVVRALVVGLAGSLFAVSARAQHATGLVLATPDQLRGIPLASTPYSGEELPRSADLSDSMPPPQNQGKQNSCVGWAVAYALKGYQERLEERQLMLFSPAYIYNQINQGRDGGSSFVDALNLLHEQGVATLADMPYDPADYLRPPSAAARAAAARFRIDTWRQVNLRDARELKAHLNAGFPVLFGALVDDGFLAAGQGFVWNGTAGQVRNGHAMVLVGYDDSRQAFKLINSWGDQWGDRGYGWVSYDHFQRAANEAYVAKDARNGPAPNVPTNVPPPPVQPTRESQFAITNVTHNNVIPGNEAAGYFMRFDGWLDIPPGGGTSDQVVISFWFDAGGGHKGPPVGSLDPTYATVQGQAACGTARYPVAPEGLRTTWIAWVSYAALNLSSGTWGPAGYQPYVSSLLAEPVLYIDDFGVKSGGLVPFTVTR